MTWLTRAEEALQRFFSNDLVPVLKTFIEQFASELGTAALNAGASFAAEVIAGKSTKDAGQELLNHLQTKGINILTHDALDIAMNAIRVHVTKIQAEKHAAENPLADPPLTALPDATPVP